MDDLFKKLVEIPSVTGKEKELTNFVDSELKSIVDETKIDALGSTIKRIGTGKTKVMLEAHVDEVGFIITYVDEKGFAYFTPLGGIKRDILIGQKVKVITDQGVIPGFIGKDKKNEITKQSAVKEMWIDIGASDNLGFPQVGDIAYFDTTYEKLHNNTILARGADNKVGVYILMQVLKHFYKSSNKNISLYSAFTTQEEIGKFGAIAAVEQVKPDYSIIVETTDATDTPNANIEEEGKTLLGKGAVITYSPKTDDRLFSLCKETAKKNNIPIQIIAQAKTSTDTDIIQSGSSGTYTMLISIAVRYMHTPAVMFSWKDVENTIKLFNKVLEIIHE